MNKLYPDVPEWVRITDMRPTPCQGNRKHNTCRVPWTDELEEIAVGMRANDVPMPQICREIELLTGVRLSAGGMRDYLNRRADPEEEEDQ